VDLENPETTMIAICPVWMTLAFQGPSGQPPVWMNVLPMVVMLAIVYFLFFGPMRKRQRALADMVANLKKGDKVVTNGGIYGEIAGVDTEGDTIVLKIADNVRIKVAKSAIAGLEKEGETQK
jgi:preprotein translocase subunit YajC